jgi:hypothetical protein
VRGPSCANARVGFDFEKSATAAAARTTGSWGASFAAAASSRSAEIGLCRKFQSVAP